jgi:hypothetical protein
VGIARVAPAYFQTLRISVRGEPSSWADTESGTAGAIVSDSLARRLWPGEDGIGKGITIGRDGPHYYRVVGIAADIRGHGFDRPPDETVFFPLVSPADAPLQGGPPRSMRVIVRTRSGEATQVVSRARSIISDVDSSVPIADVDVLDEMVTRSYANRSFTTSLLAVTAFMALMLSAVGLYGVISYGVATRRTELGVRLALGARPVAIRTMIIRDTVALTTMGLVIGLLGTFGFTRLLGSLLFGISPQDPQTLVATTALLFGVGVIAGATPAWRASRLDPSMALRSE